MDWFILQLTISVEILIFQFPKSITSANFCLSIHFCIMTLLRLIFKSIDTRKINLITEVFDLSWYSILFCYIDTSVLLENIPLVKSIMKLHPGLEWHIFHILTSEDIDDLNNFPPFCTVVCAKLPNAGWKMVSDRFVKFTEAVISSTVIFGEDRIIAELEGSFPPDKTTKMCCSLLSDIARVVKHLCL